MEGTEYAAAATHQQWTNSLGGGRGGTKASLTVMEMVGILDETYNVAECLLDSRRYDESLEAYGWVLHACEKPQAGGVDGGNGNNDYGNGRSSRGGGGSTVLNRPHYPTYGFS